MNTVRLLLLLLLPLGGCDGCSAASGCNDDDDCGAGVCLRGVCESFGPGEGEGEGEGEGAGEGEGEGEGEEGEGEGEKGEGEGEPISALCNGAVVDTQTDEDNCGECDNRCSGAGPNCDEAEFCVDGGCECLGLSLLLACAPGSADCGDGCVDLLTTKESCGECGTACVDDPACGVPTLCVDGGCLCPGAAPLCPAGEMLCGDGCVDPRKDEGNCGECGNACVDDGDFCDGVASCIEGGCAQIDPPCGEEGCDEVTDTCGACADPQFPCPDDGSFCDGFFACEASVCVGHERRCEDPALPFCDATAGVCAACVDDAGCDDDDGLLCNGIQFCVAGACVDEPDPCGDQLCSEGAGCHECDDDDNCAAGRCEPTLRFCVECLGDGDCDSGLQCNAANGCAPG
ncbi:MAG: hypothetical protein Q8O67_21395 [Deltaproteobacteria bacterium]|nr:hypothetical protein [Deltaproteobacteria bacterium]